MVFSSLLFLFRFLPVILVVYFLAPRRFRNLVLFAGSLVFYGWGEPVYVSLLILSTVIDYIHGILAERFRTEGRQKAARAAVISSAVLNLGLLGIFKYSGFLAGAVNSALGLGIPVPDLRLPIGISFYTFQTMSYTIDVYRGKVRAQRDIIAFGAYVSMFPQLIAGPIVQYKVVAGEMKGRRETPEDCFDGLLRFCAGLAKKVLIANPMGEIWTAVSGVPADGRSAAMLWMGILAYAFQIYYDFSGYSDMAIGLGRIFGFHFPENFRYPYRAASITEFWRRWHITLGSWFREYVYIPLGGNRRGLGRQMVNILIVWLLTGIWHGAGWNFLLWGLYFGALLLLEKLFLLRVLERIPKWAGWLYSMTAVLLGWVLFANEEIGTAGAYLAGMFGGGGLAWMNDRTLYMLVTAAPLFALAAAGSGEGVRRWYQKALSRRPSLEIFAGTALAAAGLALCTAYLVNSSYNPFLYFRF